LVLAGLLPAEIYLRRFEEPRNLSNPDPIHDHRLKKAAQNPS
jgi:hypothetical protein